MKLGRAGSSAVDYVGNTHTQESSVARILGYAEKRSECAGRRSECAESTESHRIQGQSTSSWCYQLRLRAFCLFCCCCWLL